MIDESMKYCTANLRAAAARFEAEACFSASSVKKGMRLSLPEVERLLKLQIKFSQHRRNKGRQNSKETTSCMLSNEYRSMAAK